LRQKHAFRAHFLWSSPLWRPRIFDFSGFSAAEKKGATKPQKNLTNF
jgi:hypothetical protein